MSETNGVVAPPTSMLVYHPGRLYLSLMTRKNKLLPLLALATAFILWGLNAPFIAIGLDSLPVMSLIAIKFCFGAVVFLYLARKHWVKLPLRLWIHVIIATACGYALASILFYEGIKLTGALNASLLYLASPLLLYFLSIEILKDRFSAKLLVGVITGLVGAFLIVGAPIFDNQYEGNASILGSLMIIAAAITDIVGAIIIKPALNKVAPMQMTAVRFAIAAVLFTPFLFIQSSQLAEVIITPALIIAVGYNLIFATLCSYFLYHWGLSKMSSEQSSPFYYLDPMFGAIGAMVILGEQLTTYVLAGAALIVVGLIVSEGHRPYFRHFGHHR